MEETKLQYLERLNRCTEEALIKANSSKVLAKVVGDLKHLRTHDYHFIESNHPFATVFWGACSGIIGIILIIASASAESFILAFVGIALCLGFGFIYTGYSDIKTAQENKKIRKAAIRLLPKMEKALKKKLSCPEEEIRSMGGAFYEECKIYGATSLNDEYSRKKAINLLQSLIGVEFDQSLQFYTNKVDACFEISKKLWLIQHDKEEAARIEWNKTPHKAKLSKKVIQEIETAKTLSFLSGIKKRQYILNNTYTAIQTELLKKQEGEKALRQLGTILATSVHQERKGDWAFLAGIADGIAGPGAGLSVAASTMIENEKIEYRNQQRRAGAAKTIQMFQNAAGNVNAEIRDLERAQDLISYERVDLNDKVVLEKYDTQTIFKKLKIDHSIRKRADNALDITLTVSTNMDVDVPNIVKTTIDGALIAKIYCDDTFVGECYLPMPTYGLQKGTKEKIEGICPMYMEGDRQYRIEIAPKKLWVMEL